MFFTIRDRFGRYGFAYADLRFATVQQLKTAKVNCRFLSCAFLHNAQSHFYMSKCTSVIAENTALWCFLFALVMICASGEEFDRWYLAQFLTALVQILPLTNKKLALQRVLLAGVAGFALDPREGNGLLRGSPSRGSTVSR